MRKGLVAAAFVALSVWLTGSPPPVPPARQPTVTQEQHEQDREHPPKGDRGTPPPPEVAILTPASTTASGPPLIVVNVTPRAREPQEAAPEEMAGTASASEIGMILLVVLSLPLLLVAVLFWKVFGSIRWVRVVIGRAAERTRVTGPLHVVAADTAAQGQGGS